MTHVENRIGVYHLMKAEFFYALNESVVHIDDTGGFFRWEGS